MFSATDFLPSFMIEFMNLDTIRSPNFGSGLTSRFSALCRRDIRLFLHQPCPNCDSAAGSLPAARGCPHRGAATQNDPSYLGRIAPYFDSLCLRSATPCVSSTPRMM